MPHCCSSRPSSSRRPPGPSRAYIFEQLSSSSCPVILPFGLFRVISSITSVTSPHQSSHQGCFCQCDAALSDSPAAALPHTPSKGRCAPGTNAFPYTVGVSNLLRFWDRVSTGILHRSFKAVSRPQANSQPPERSFRISAADKTARLRKRRQSNGSSSQAGAGAGQLASSFDSISLLMQPVDATVLQLRMYARILTDYSEFQI